MNLEFEIQRGADPFFFGIDRELTQEALLAGQSKSISWDSPENDIYASNGLKLGFDSRNQLEFIEVFAPSTAVFSGVALVDSPLQKTLKAIKSLGYEYTKDGACYHVNRVNIVLYAPSGKVESAAIHVEGYYSTDEDSFEDDLEDLGFDL